MVKRDEFGKPTNWWTTVPGVLTALAGLITATAGLLIALNQIGFFDKTNKRPAMTQNDAVAPAVNSTTVTAGSPKATSPSAERLYPITLPAGQELKAGEAVYKILGIELNRRSANKIEIKVTARMTNNSPYPANYWGNTFRLWVDEVPLAPAKSPNDVVQGHAASEAEFLFVVPQGFNKLELQAGNPEQETDKVVLELAHKG